MNRLTQLIRHLLHRKGSQALAGCPPLLSHGRISEKHPHHQVNLGHGKANSSSAPLAGKERPSLLTRNPKQSVFTRPGKSVKTIDDNGCWKTWKTIYTILTTWSAQSERQREK